VGIIDVRLTLVDALHPVGTVSDVRMYYRDKKQVVRFKFTEPNMAPRDEELVLPGSADLIPALKTAAEIMAANIHGDFVAS